MLEGLLGKFRRKEEQFTPALRQYLKGQEDLCESILNADSISIIEKYQGQVLVKFELPSKRYFIGFQVEPCKVLSFQEYGRALKKSA
jgi:hypothetical protein